MKEARHYRRRLREGAPHSDSFRSSRESMTLKGTRTSELKEREFDMRGAGVSNTWRNDHRWTNTPEMFSHH